jgi:hypothetical protein
LQTQDFSRFRHQKIAEFSIPRRTSVNALTRAIATTLTGYAFETIPGKAIITGATKGPDDIEPNASFGMPTPEPATLSALAMEAPGLSIRRRKETVLVDD